MHSFKTLISVGVLATMTSAIPTMRSQFAATRRAAESRLTVYWGAEDDSTTLEDVCNDDSYNIVNLAFVDYFHSDGGYPSLSLSSLGGPSQAQKAVGATALKDGSSLVPAIKACQSSGKLVLLSLGGAKDFADVTLKDDSDGEKIADTLWDLFGGGTNGTTTQSLRPFGSVKLDGFDLDSTGYTAFVSKMRSNFNSDSTKQYYLSAAPQCPYPDASIPLDICTQLDFVFTQFYNNGDCNIAQSGFNDAVKKWSSGIGDAQLFIGALASDADGDEGYVDADALVEAIKGVEEMGLPNYGGAMLWEAQLAVKNGDYQKTVAAGL